MAEKKYDIESITRRTTLTPAGKFEELYEVTFTTVSGVRDTVTIAEKEYTAAKIKETVEAKVAIHEAVMGL